MKWGFVWCEKMSDWPVWSIKFLPRHYYDNGLVRSNVQYYCCNIPRTDYDNAMKIQENGQVVCSDPADLDNYILF